MLKLVLLVPGFVLLAALSQQPGPPAPPAASAPGKTTPETIAHAKKFYALDCAMCHGATGDGKGELVANMKLTLKDYTDPASLSGLTDAQIFDIIQNGKGRCRAKEPA